MPNYIYTAKTKKGESRAGHEEATNERELANRLRSRGIFLIKAEMAGVKKPGLGGMSFLDRFNRISLVEKMMFTRHLAVMIKAGFSLDKALRVLARQSQSYKFKQIIAQIEKDIRRGQPFAAALSKYPKVFNELYTNMVRVGEIGGNLEEVLIILVEQMRKEHELISRVKGAIIYPTVIIVAMIGIGILMMIMVVPKLNEVFIELGVELPLSTKIIIGLSVFLKNYFIVGLIGLALVVFLINKAIKTASVKRMFHRFFLFLPIFGVIVQKLNIARFASTFSSLVDSGLDIVRSLDITAGTLGNIFFREALLSSAKQVQKGKNLSETLSKYEHLYSPMVIQMIQVGEETGNLSSILKTLSSFYEEEIANITKGLSSVIEPMLMIIVGAAVGFFAISMIQPMYSMIGGV